MSTGVLRIPLESAGRRAGRPVHLVLREPTAAEFFAGAPDIFPDTECFAKFSDRQRFENLRQQAAWLDHLIERCAIGDLKGRKFRLLPSDRDAVAAAVLHAWRWTERDGRVNDFPAKDVAEILLRLAKRTGRLPHELWQLPVSDVLFDYRIFFAKDAEVAARKRQRRPAMNDPDLPDELPGGEAEAGG